MVKCEILEQGEQALLYKLDGKVQLIRGPKRIWLFTSKLVRLKRYTAQHDEYLKIKMLDGRVEHRIGPCSEVLNTKHLSDIRVKACYCLDANQAILVYQAKKLKDEKLEYLLKVIRGPGIFMPEPHEWTHKFSWHGVDEASKTTYISDSNKFEILNCAPDQLYYNVNEVRTSDDALIRVKLMIFYELKDILTMIHETKDPIGDFLNCARSDVISFATTRTYLQFIESCHLLNDLEHFPRLVERASAIGFEVTKVVFRGYFASDKLQQMHDKSISTRTKLKLEFESELQKQEQINTNIKNEIERISSEQDLELEKLKSQLEREKLKQENERKLKLNQELESIRLAKETELVKIQSKEKENQVKLEQLRQLKEVRVDLTEYLLSERPQVDKIIRIDTTKQSNEAVAIHLHEP